MCRTAGKLRRKALGLDMESTYADLKGVVHGGFAAAAH
jgi:hypothetical protein